MPSLHTLADKVFEHGAPRGPVVGPFVAPHREFVRDAFCHEETGKIARGAGILITALSRGDKDVTFVVERIQVFAAEVRDVLDRIVEIDVVVVVIAVHIVTNVIITAHGDGARKQVGTAKELVGGVIRAERRACRNDADATPTRVPDVGDDLVADIFVVLDLTPCHCAGMQIAIEPCLAVDAVDGKDLDPAGVNKRGKHVNHLKAFVFQKVRRRCGKQEQWKTIVPISNNFHPFVERWAVPAVNKAIHKRPRVDDCF